MVFLPVGPYMPDQPDYKNPGSNVCTNLVPLTKITGGNGQPRVTYGPMPSLSIYSSNTLDGPALGAYAVTDPDGDVFIFAGDGTKLYKLAVGVTTFADASKAGGYTTAADQKWNATLFGTKVIFTNFTDPIQSFELGVSSLFADLSESAPKARFVGVVKDFFVTANTNDPTDGAQPQRVWWSAVDDATNFPTPGSVTAAQLQSDYQDLVGDAGWIQGLVGQLGTSDGAIFQERAIVRMNYIGPPAIFDFRAAEGVRGSTRM